MLKNKEGDGRPNYRLYFDGNDYIPIVTIMTIIVQRESKNRIADYQTTGHLLTMMLMPIVPFLVVTLS